MDVIRIGLFNRVEGPRVTYMYCNKCCRWYTCCTNRPWPLVCPRDRVPGKKHLTWEGLCARLKALDAPVTAPSILAWLLSSFCTVRRSEIKKFWTERGSALESAPAREVALECFRATRGLVAVAPRPTTAFSRLVYEWASALNSPEHVRSSVPVEGHLICETCRKKKNPRFIVWCPRGHPTCIKCQEATCPCGARFSDGDLDIVEKVLKT